ncbi:MAG: hypothetical protein KJ077_10805 [Anaerolineae bacterium]|nr:hypothetical protein [Anaerolineae bacterium]
MPTTKNISSLVTNSPAGRASSISDEALTALFTLCKGVRHGGLIEVMGFALSGGNNYEQFIAQLDAKESALRHIAGTGQRLDNAALDQQLKVGDAVLYINGGGYGWYLGRLTSIKRFTPPAQDNNGPYGFNLVLSQPNNTDVNFTTLPQAGWWSSKDEFYVFRPVATGVSDG